MSDTTVKWNDMSESNDLFNVSLDCLQRKLNELKKLYERDLRFGLITEQNYKIRSSVIADVLLEFGLENEL